MPPENVVGAENIRNKMNRKPVLYRAAKTVLALKKDSEFRAKKLCDGPVLNLGDTCAYSCEFCYVDAMVHRFAKGTLVSQRPDSNQSYRDVVIRRRNSVELLRNQLLKPKGPRFSDPDDRRVVFNASLVDVAANMDLLKETAAALNVIFQYTAWEVRLLSKSNLLHRLIEDGLVPEKYHRRIIFGVSTGTLDERIARAIETGTPNVEMRLQSLHWLQDRGFRTYGMICPSLPQENPAKFSRKAYDAIRGDQCEHIWAEVINVRGRSMKRTLQGLTGAGLATEAEELKAVSGPKHKAAWEQYARNTFLGHTSCIPPEKLRFLQYVSKETSSWWRENIKLGAVPLGKASIQNPPDSPEATHEAAPKGKTFSTMSLQIVDGGTKNLSRPISSDEESRLADLERTVSEAVQASINAAKALHEIYSYKDGIFWKQTYKSFEEYCFTKWGYRKAHSYRLLGAGGFIARISEANQPATAAQDGQNHTWLPQNEAQVRQILRLPEKDQVVAWNEFTSKTPANLLSSREIAREVRVFAKKKKISLHKNLVKELTPVQRAEKALQTFLEIAAKLPNASEIKKHAESIALLIPSPQPAKDGEKDQLP